MIFISLTLYFVVQFFSHGTNKKWRIAAQSNTKEENGKNKAEKVNTEQNVSLHDRNIYSKFYIWLLYISWLIFHDTYLLFFNTLATQNTDDTETEAENEDIA